MSEMIEVQRGAPVPAVDRSRPKGARKYPVATMAVDEFFLIPDRSVRQTSAYVSRITRNLPGKFATRQVWMVATPGGWRLAEEGASEARKGVGVWRTE